MMVFCSGIHSPFKSFEDVEDGWEEMKWEWKSNWEILQGCHHSSGWSDLMFSRMVRQTTTSNKYYHRLVTTKYKVGWEAPLMVFSTGNEKRIIVKKKVFLYFFFSGWRCQVWFMLFWWGLFSFYSRLLEGIGQGFLRFGCATDWWLQ